MDNLKALYDQSTPETRKQALASKASIEGAFSPDAMQATFERMAKMAPEAQVTECGATTVEDKAYITLLINQGMQGGAATTDPKTPITDNGAGTKPAKGKKGKASKPVIPLTSDEAMHYFDVLRQQSPERHEKSQNTIISKLIIDKPHLGSYAALDKVKGVIVKESWDKLQQKIKEGTYVVKPDDGPEAGEKRILSTTNYEALKKAAEAGESVDIYGGKFSAKVIGYEVTKPENEGPEYLTREEMINYVVFKAGGFILASDTTPGVTIRNVKDKSASADGVESNDYKTVLSDTNKKNALEAKSYEISRVATNDTHDQLCKSELCFKVLDNGHKVAAKDKENVMVPSEKLIRVSLKAQLPQLEREAKFVAKFGDGSSNSNKDLRQMPQGKQLKKINETLIHAIAIIQKNSAVGSFEKGLDSLSGTDNVPEELKAFQLKPEEAPTGAVI